MFLSHVGDGAFLLSKPLSQLLELLQTFTFILVSK